MQLKACRIKIYDKAYYKDEKTSTTIPPHKNMYTTLLESYISNAW